MSFKHKRICPICGREWLVNISSHLEQVHQLGSVERKPYLEIAKYQGTTAYNNVEPSIPKIKRVTAKAKNRTLKYNAKQSVKRIKATQWSKYPYPEFRFEHPFSIMVVGPTASGKTFFVMQLLQSNQMKGFCIEWYYNHHQQSYDDFSARVGRTRVTFKAGLPKYSENYLKGIDSKKKRVIVLDDLMDEAKGSKLVSKLFTQ